VELEHEELGRRAKVTKIDLINTPCELKRMGDPKAQVSGYRYPRTLGCALPTLSTFKHSERSERPRDTLPANVDDTSIAPCFAEALTNGSCSNFPVESNLMADNTARGPEEWVSSEQRPEMEAAPFLMSRGQRRCPPNHRFGRRARLDPCPH
jgi:hypothetical protein